MANRTNTGRVLPLLFFGVLMGALDIAIVGPALPAIGQSFGVSAKGLQWVFTIYVLFNVVGVPLMAKLADRIGRRAVYVGDVLLFGVGSIVVASAPSFWVLLAGRAMQGFGAGGSSRSRQRSSGTCSRPRGRAGRSGCWARSSGSPF
nr:MFS transporter [Rubrobacter aplysinae]